jgi:nitrate/nitrite transporter NarK
MITEKVDLRFTATATGVVNAFWQLGSVIVPTIVGMVFAATSSFSLTFAILAAGPLIGAFCMFAVHESAGIVRGRNRTTGSVSEKGESR